MVEKSTGADTFIATLAVLVPLFQEGKVMVSPPHCDVGTTALGERAFRPWTPPETLAREVFDELLVRVELLKFVTVIRWVQPTPRPAEIIALPFGLVRSLGFSLEGNSYLGSLRILPL